MPDSPLSSTIPGYVHEIESLRKEIQALNDEVNSFKKLFNESQEVIESSLEKNEKLNKENKELKSKVKEIISHSLISKETSNTTISGIVRGREAEEITYLRGIVENFSKGGENVR